MKFQIICSPDKFEDVKAAVVACAYVRSEDMYVIGNDVTVRKTEEQTQLENEQLKSSIAQSNATIRGLVELVKNFIEKDAIDPLMDYYNTNIKEDEDDDY